MPKITDENITVFTDEPLYKQHTHEIILPATRREIWLTLVGVVLFVVLVNVGVKLYLNDHTTNRGYWLARQKWLLLEQLEEPVSWLVVGDSSANQGVIPALLPGAAASGGLNLATVGNFGVVDDVWMLQNYIARFGPPENVLMVHVYDVWPREPDAIMLAQIPIPQREWSTYSPQVVLNRQQQVDYWLARYFPLYAENQTLSLIIRRRVLGNSAPRRLELTPDGYMPLAATAAAPSQVRTIAQNHLALIQQAPFTVAPSNAAAMTELVRLADQYSINVYLAISPLYEGLATDPTFQGRLTEVQTYLLSVADQSDHIHFIPAIITFPAEQMEDVDHLTEPAAREYTRQLSDEIQKIMHP